MGSTRSYSERKKEITDHSIREGRDAKQTFKIYLFVFQFFFEIMLFFFLIFFFESMNLFFLILLHFEFFFYVLSCFETFFFEILCVDSTIPRERVSM